MTKGRFILATAVAVVMVGMHLFALAIQKDDFPFCVYGMYSQRYPWRYPPQHLFYKNRAVRFYGVTKSGDEFYLRDRDLYPLQYFETSQAVNKLLHMPNGKQRARAAVADILRRYNLNRHRRGRLSGSHQEWQWGEEGRRPDLIGMRAYHAYWDKLDPRLRNRHTPEHRVLIAEVMR